MMCPLMIGKRHIFGEPTCRQNCQDFCIMHQTVRRVLEPFMQKYNRHDYPEMWRFQRNPWAAKASLEKPIAERKTNDRTDSL